MCTVVDGCRHASAHFCNGLLDVPRRYGTTVPRHLSCQSRRPFLARRKAVVHWHLYNTVFCHKKKSRDHFRKIMSFITSYLFKPLSQLGQLTPALSSALLFGLSFDHGFVTLPPLTHLANESINKAFNIFLANSLPLLALTSGSAVISGTRAAFGSPSNSWSR